MPGKGKPFTKGWEGGPGRPPGSCNKKKIRWNNLQDLAEWAQETLADINNPKIVLDYIQHKERLLFEKLSNVPSTPAESVENTNPESELNQAEANGNTQPGNDPVRMGTGETQIQA